MSTKKPETSLSWSGRTSTPVADGGHSPLPRFECVCQMNDDPGPRRSEGVAQRHRASVDVDLFGVKVEGLHVGQGHDREGLVDLPQVDVFGLQFRLYF